ncbi:MAG: SDR family NAD(P)-dependent oxidoreductase [Bacteroidales bacterium]|nr:SDR family NAD(P)-dependent oxidoreductase [Bacteroidales bacterium]
MKLLENKKALITGAARGIGKAIAIAYAKNGADVAITDLKIDDDAQALVEELKGYGVQAKAYASDASNFAACEELVKEVLNDFGNIDILVNNAGITRDKLLMRMGEDDWDLVLKVNLKSVFNMTKAIPRSMLS